MEKKTYNLVWTDDMNIIVIHENMSMSHYSRESIEFDEKKYRIEDDMGCNGWCGWSSSLYVTRLKGLPDNVPFEKFTVTIEYEKQT